MKVHLCWLSLNSWSQHDLMTSDLSCQSPEEGQRIDRKFEVCPNFCVEIMGLDSIFIKTIFCFCIISLRIAYIFGEGDVIQKVNGVNCKLIVKTTSVGCPVKCLTWWKIVHQIASFKPTFSKLQQLRGISCLRHLLLCPSYCTSFDQC